MILRKISIFGFKSFAEKTELHFGDGITAVIGPNGCGKTNVVDAIRWVFGEQKTTILRSAHMQDVIFSGSEKRQPLNMAEVTLSISNTSGILPIEYNEISITRRIFRSGESDYLINRTPSRLRDIHNIFVDTGVSSSAYTTIENSMINHILSDKAEERRFLFEEAAGIGKYKQRVKESQRKLDRTRQDLLRINDRVQEKERYVRMLGRQVEKARRYKRYHDDLKNLEVGFENQRYKLLNTKLTERKNKIAELEKEIGALKIKIATAESKIEKMELNKVEREKELQGASKNVSDASEKINTVDREMSVANQSLTHLRENVIRCEHEIESFDSQSSEKKILLSNIEKSMVSRETELNEGTIKVDRMKKELEGFDAQVQMKRKRDDELSQKQLELVHSAGVKQKELSNCQTNLRNCIERCARDEDEIRRLEEHIEDYRFALDKCKKELEKANESFENYSKTREKLLHRIEEEDGRYHSFVGKEKSLEAKIDSCKSKQHFLKALDASFEGYGQGIKSLLEKKLPGTMGIVADLINLEDPKMVNIVERALGSAIQTVVFKTDANLKAAMEYLRAEKVGVARMVSLESLKAIGHRAPVLILDKSLPLRIYIDTEEECKELADSLFNRILLCDDDKTALKLQTKAELDSLIVSHDGAVCYSDGTVVAGVKKEEQAGILRRRYEIEKLTDDLQAFQDEYDSVIHDKESCIITRDEAKRALVEIDEKLNTGRQIQHEQETNIKHYKSEIENIKERIQGLVPELSKNRTSISEYRWFLKEHGLSIEEVSAKRADIEKQIASAKTHLGEMDVKRSELAKHLKNAELAEQGLKNRIEQDKQSIEHLKKDMNNLDESRQKKNEEKNNALNEIRELEEKTVVFKERLEREATQREGLQKTLLETREGFRSVVNAIEGERREIKTFRDNLEEILNRKHELEVHQTRDEEQQHAIREKVFNAYEIDLLSPPDDMPVLDREDAEVAENIHLLKERIRRIGEVNISAIGEFEQESHDLKEMVVQRDDLQTAVDDLERAIKKLNREARVQFTNTFEKVQKNFKDMFTTLFEGGEATLTLEEDEDPLVAAIKINARPAGKKMRGITLLSGGERALTAISLLFALYLVKPSAYCILDELDAPLDDANIDRFVRVLKKFSEKTQFIIITHNKHTMEAADLLYGVTQQESGVSTVASVVLGEDRQLRAA